MITWAQLGFQDANSPMINEFIYFNDFVITIVVFILCVVGVRIILRSTSVYLNKNIYQAQILEWAWTLLPAVILIEIALPSLQLLYCIEEYKELSYFHNIKVIGHQWYWAYAVGRVDTGPIKAEPSSINSYMVPQKDLNFNGVRLLDVDNYLLLPYGKPVSLTVTSSDVLHSLAVPSLGVKIDACPGRLNQITFVSHRPGIFFGQCSEICGSNHRFMPIVLEFAQDIDVLNWIIEVWPHID